jgi:Flp pilus assembly protein TadG
MLPVVAFLFVGALDMGFYSFALISLEGATRTAALYTATNSTTAADSTGACAFVLGELRSLPNVSASLNTCEAAPVTVTAQTVSGAGGTSASQVSVAYQSLLMIPIPGVLAQQFTWTRTVKMPLRN